MDDRVGVSKREMSCKHSYGLSIFYTDSSHFLIAFHLTLLDSIPIIGLLVQGQSPSHTISTVGMERVDFSQTMARHNTAELYFINTDISISQKRCGGGVSFSICNLPTPTYE